jgi:hypothetical protein
VGMGRVEVEMEMIEEVRSRGRCPERPSFASSKKALVVSKTHQCERTLLSIHQCTIWTRGAATNKCLAVWISDCLHPFARSRLTFTHTQGKIPMTTLPPFSISRIEPKLEANLMFHSRCKGSMVDPFRRVARQERFTRYFPTQARPYDKRGKAHGQGHG